MKKRPKRFALLAVLSGVLCLGSAVNVRGAGGATWNTLRPKVDFLKRSLEREQRRVKETDRELLLLDTDIEDRIDQLVTVLTTVKDSPTTDGAVAKLKARVLAGLRRTVDLYVKERHRNRQHGWNTEKLDERIDKRVKQMAQLAASLPDVGNIDEYADLGAGYDMDAAVKALKEGQMSGHKAANLAQLKQELEDTLDFFKEQRELLATQASITIDPDLKTKLTTNIATLDGLIAKREKQLAIIKKMPQNEGEKPIGMDSVRDLERVLQREVKNLQEDFRELLALKSKRDSQMKGVEYLQRQLNTAQAQLNRIVKQSEK